MQTFVTHVPPAQASRRKWLKGLGALVGTSLLAAPLTTLAQLAGPGERGLSALPAGRAEGLGIVKLFADPEVPQGWVRCDGRLLLISQHPALFAALGTAYGGDGQRTFALPKLCDDAAPAATPLARRPLPTFLFAMKAASGPATPPALAELRLPHQCRQASPAARRA